MKKLSFFNKIIYTVNIIFIVGLIFSFFAPYLPPQKFGIFSLVSLIVPILIFANLLFLVYWILIGFKKEFFLSAFVILLGYFLTSPIYKFSSSLEEKKLEKQLSIMSYNIRKFNIYNWIDDANIPQKISAFIEEENPDIVTLQEFKKDKNFILKYPYQYIHRSYNWNKSHSYPSGLAFFSKYPIIDTGAVKYKKVFTSIAYIDILKNKDTIRIYNFHLESLGVVPNKDYFGHKNSEGLIKRLGKSFKIQQKEVDTLNYSIKNCKTKFVVTGDMNNTPYSWVYRNLTKNIKDSFLEAGSGFGKTYSFNSFPLRIDYIFVDKDIKVHQHKNYTIKYSDHFPIMATVSF